MQHETIYRALLGLPMYLERNSILLLYDISMVKTRMAHSFEWSTFIPVDDLTQKS